MRYFRHTFGGVLSPSCSNYALKKTADDNKVKYGSDAPDTCNKKFYVDDMLKSVVNVPEAISDKKLLETWTGLVV